ncbi:MAG: hypothetical protein AAF078_11795 [Planctomycetota bacterium]
MSGSTASDTGWAIEGMEVSRDGQDVVLAVPDTDYRLHLVVAEGLVADERGDLRGVIRADAKRVDVIKGGGRYVEPVIGRPRRVQGRIVAGEGSTGSIVVRAGVGTLVCRLTDPRQSLADFSVGQLVSFDVLRGARLEPA